MVHAIFIGNFQRCVQQELGAVLAGPPVVHHGGEEKDHYRGLAHGIATQLLSRSETYEPTEFLYGYIPIRAPALPYLFFELSVLGVKGKGIPGVVHTAAVVRVPIPGTIITPQIGWRHRFVPLSAIYAPDFHPRDKFDIAKRESEVFKRKVGWYPLLESLNNDKAAQKAAATDWWVSTIGAFEVAVHPDSPMGITQLAPYKGRTILTMQRAPSRKAAPNKPWYELRKIFDSLSLMTTHLLRNPTSGAQVDDLVVTPANAAMMDLVVRQIEAATIPRATAPVP